MLLSCTDSIPERGDLVEDLLAIDDVVSVQELVTAVGESDRDISPVATTLLEMGLELAHEVLVRSQETTPSGGSIRNKTARRGYHRR